MLDRYEEEHRKNPKCNRNLFATEIEGGGSTTSLEDHSFLPLESKI